MNRSFLLNAVLVGASFLAGCDFSKGYSEQNTVDGSDPVVEDFAVFYISRSLPRDIETDPTGQTLIPMQHLQGDAFTPGASLKFRARADLQAPEITLTEGVFENGENELGESLYDVKDLSLAHDGSQLLFAMRAPEIEDADEDEQPTWNIWHYDTTSGALTRVIEDDQIAEASDDIAPLFLPGNKIAFSSTRQRRARAILLDESKPQFANTVESDNEVEAFVLHTMDDTGTNIEQISFNQSHDMHPTLLSDGRLAFMRWNNRNQDRLSLYTTHPDGSQTANLYGYNDNAATETNPTPAILTPLSTLPDGRLLALQSLRQSHSLGGDLVTLDWQNFSDANQPIAATGSGASGQQSISQNRITLVADQISQQGYFNDAYPLHDGTDRLLTSWSPCRIMGIALDKFVDLDLQLINAQGEWIDANSNLADAPVAMELSALRPIPCPSDVNQIPTALTALPQYGIWIYDTENNTRAPILFPQAGHMISEIIAAEKHTQVPFIEPISLYPSDTTQALIDEQTGVLHIRSVYDLDGTDSSPAGIDALADPSQTPADARPAYFVRFVKAVSRPVDNLFDIDFGLANGFGNRPLRDIIGYAPVHPDGSVMVRLPADIPISFTLTDQNGHTLDNALGEEHNTWLTLRAGEERTCHGCHDAQTPLAHGRPEAQAASINLGASANVEFTNSLLTDENSQPFSAPTDGQTMAQHYYQSWQTHTQDTPANDLNRLKLYPNVNLIFNDEWTDTTQGLTKAPSFSATYQQLLTPAPVNLTGCIARWHALCRVTIHYPDHIQPLWQLARTVTVNDVQTDVTCTGCHASVDADGNNQIAAPGNDNQLDLLGAFADPQDDYPISYRQLLRRSNIQALCDNGTLIDERRPATNADPFQWLQEVATDDMGNTQYQQQQQIRDNVAQYQADDGMGNIVTAPLSIEDDPMSPLTLLRDTDNNPIAFMENRTHTDATPLVIQYIRQDACELGGAEPAVETITVEQGQAIPLLVNRLDESSQPMPHRIATGNQTRTVMSANGANSSALFFNVFNDGGAHSGYLSTSELKLIAEWLDIGAQYYNDPFKTLPQD